MPGGSRGIAAVLATLLIASPALADRKPPTEKDKQLAGELVKRAIAKSKQGDHDAAIAIYQQAYATVASSALLSNIGSEYQQVGKPKEALRYFCEYLEKDPVGANAPFAMAQAKLLQSQLANREVDDAELCAAPKVVEAAPPAPPTDPPRHDIIEAPPALTPKVQPRGNPTLKYAGLGAGAAGLIAASIGVYYGVQAKKISDEISSHSTDKFWDKIQERQAEGQHDENLQVGFLVAGGALITTGVILYMLGRPSASSAVDQTAIHVVPTTNGFAVLGGF